MSSASDDDKSPKKEEEEKPQQQQEESTAAVPPQKRVTIDTSAPTTTAAAPADAPGASSAAEEKGDSAFQRSPSTLLKQSMGMGTTSGSFDEHHNQRIRGRTTQKFVKTDEGEEVPAVEYFNLRHNLRTVIPIEQSLTLFQTWVLAPLLNAFIWLLTNVFFREIDIVGAEHLIAAAKKKNQGIVIMLNHNNQFLDAILIQSVFAGIINRAEATAPPTMPTTTTTAAAVGSPINKHHHSGGKGSLKFIMAEKSMNRPIIGQFARLMGAVPVVRPQDVPSTVGAGKIVKITGVTVTGQDTKFKEEVHAGDVIQWSVPTGSVSDGKCNAQVHTIESDTQLTLTLPVEASHEVTNKPTSFQISRRIDHSEMYASVYGTLETGGAIGIFPEGGSHDRTSLLPLKAGVALFSLGAAERGIDVLVIPAGLTYFYGHKFRSRAYVEFGKPIHPPAELIKTFSSDKRSTTGAFLRTLETALRDVTINCEDWNTLKFVHSFRRLYQDPGLRLETIDYLRLTRRLARITQDRDKEPEFAEFRSRVENYIDFCNALFVRDAQAATLGNLKENVSVMLLFRRLVVLSILFFTLVPFFVIAGPVGVASYLAAEAHARTALSASSVKVVGADVKASYKIIMGFTLFPLMCFFISGLVYWHSGGDMRTAATVFLCVPMAMYVSLFLVHEFVLELYAALPLFMSLVSNHKQFVKLHERRTRLVQAAHSIVQKFDPALAEEMSVYDNVASPVGPAPSFFSLRHRSHASM